MELACVYDTCAPSTSSPPPLRLAGQVIGLRGRAHGVHIFTRDVTGLVYLPTQLEGTATKRSIT